MSKLELNLESELELPSDDSPEILEALERGLKASDEGRVVPIEQVRELVKQWSSKSISPIRR